MPRPGPLQHARQPIVGDAVKRVSDGRTAGQVGKIQQRHEVYPQWLRHRCSPPKRESMPFFMQASSRAYLLFYEIGRQLEGTVEADDLYHTAGHKGQAKQGGTKSLGRTPRGRRKKREPGRGHYDKDRPAIIAWISRQGGVIVQATRDFTVKTVQKAADLAIQAGSRLSTDSASSYRALKGYVHEYVNHTQKEYARGDVHENRAECLFSLLKPYLRVFRGISKTNLPG